MFKRITAIILCLIIIVFSFSGCFGRMKADESFAVPILDEPTSLDPQIADSDAEKMIVLNCYEGLLRVNENGELENGVAQSYSVSDDGLTYTFNLRHNAHWALFSGHKSVLGEKYGEDYKNTFDITVYAEDFEFAFDRVFDSAIASPYASVFECISSYEAVDRFTFRITLKYKYDGFLNTLTYAGAMPCDREFFELTGGKYGLDAKYMLCNGAFNASRWTEGTSIRIVRNDDYNGEDKIMPASVTFYINASQSLVADKMNLNTYDAAFLNSSDYNSLGNKDDYNAVPVENTVYSLVFNQANKYLENRNIRLAISHSVDSSLAQGISENIVEATGLVPPFCKIGNESYADISGTKLLSYNADAAKAYFDEGLSETGDSSVEIDFKCTAEYEQFIKQLVQIMQKNLGVKFVASVTVLESTELDAAVADGNYAVVFYPFTANSSNANEFLESFENNSIFNYNSNEYSLLMSEMRANSGDFSALKNYCERAEELLLKDAVMLPVIFENSYFITGKDTGGIYFYSSQSNISFFKAVKK